MPSTAIDEHVPSPASVDHTYVHGCQTRRPPGLRKTVLGGLWSWATAAPGVSDNTTASVKDDFSMKGARSAAEVEEIGSRWERWSPRARSGRARVVHRGRACDQTLDQRLSSQAALVETGPTVAQLRGEP